MKIEQSVRVDLPDDPSIAERTTVAYIFHTTAVDESVFFEETINKAVIAGRAGPEGWIPIELRVAAHFGMASLETWERVPVIEDREIREICEQARSKAMWRQARHEPHAIDRLTIELRPASTERAEYRLRSPIEMCFEVDNKSDVVQAFLAEEKNAIAKLQAEQGEAFDFVSWSKDYHERLGMLLRGSMKP